MNVTKILSVVFLILSIALGVHLVNSIKSTIDDREMISTREAAVIKKLEFIREAEILYQEVNGNYTSDWDKLIDFIENGQYPIIQKTEIIKTLDYGADSSYYEYDTLGMVPARDRIFKQTHNVNAANDGLFVDYKVSNGEKVVQGAPAYTLNQNGKNVTHKFKNSGKISNQISFANGQKITKGELMMSVQETKFDENMDISRLPYVPGYEDVKFEIFADEIERSNLLVDVIEVKNPKPFDNTRTEDNDAKNRKPLRFGSRTDVTTSGNWE